MSQSLAILLAAGSGERLGADRPKAFVSLGGRPLLQWSLDALAAADGVDRVVVTLPEGEWELPEGVTSVRGGQTRSHSVRNALAVAAGDAVLVHDAARPLLTASLIDSLLDEFHSSGHDGVIAAAPVVDTVKRVDHDRIVTETLERSRLWAAQTPQIFRREALEQALTVSDELLAEASDDAWLVERAGGSVKVFPVDEPNPKITTASDLELTELLIKRKVVRSDAELKP